ncbi:hypothetical protein PN4B1_16600 [Paenibacillus naphthalenovorans]|uniref:hypothetical protein n=1 Tax=Paenibacillus naphthalenovorans TaxID=162209 RepID=UPI0010B938A2|nr:hypothetical protein [Paenibacillus naphthalenovorans]GCL71755.1 hypothetical protein PN4B1_16600 [Paenibacillus naphthalenovorans]
MKKLPTMITKIDGVEVPFRDYLREEDNSNLYESDIQEILQNWRHADWVYTDDYIAPIAAQVITDACEHDSELYKKIMTVIEEAYLKIGPKIREQPIITRIK